MGRHLQKTQGRSSHRGPEGNKGGQDSRMNREADRLEMINHKAEAGSARPVGQALPTSHFIQSSDHHTRWVLRSPPFSRRGNRGAERVIAFPGHAVSERWLPNEARVQSRGPHADPLDHALVFRCHISEQPQGARRHQWHWRRGQRNAPPAHLGWLTTRGGGDQKKCVAALCHLVQPAGSCPGVGLGHISQPPPLLMAPSAPGILGGGRICEHLNSGREGGFSSPPQLPFLPISSPLLAPPWKTLWMVHPSIEDPRGDHPHAPARVRDKAERELLSDRTSASARGQLSQPRRESLCRPPKLLRAGNPQAGGRRRGWEPSHLSALGSFTERFPTRWPCRTEAS